MPVYLCKPGWSATEPWRHGVQVYARPFPLVQNARGGNNYNVNQSSFSNTNREHGSHDISAASRSPTIVAEAISTESNDDQQERIPPSPPRDDEYQSHPFVPNSSLVPKGVPIRRVRHAELVLVDEVSIHYGTYWLRLRWPGPRGGVAGYIALGGEIPVACIPVGSGGHTSSIRPVSWNNNNNMASRASTVNLDNAGNFPRGNSTSEIDATKVGVNTNENPMIDNTTSVLNTVQDEAIKCDATGLFYPTSPAMELLPMYNDGLSGTSGSDEVDEHGREQIFCRICREGIHDIDYDFQAEGGNNNHRVIDVTTLPQNELRGMNTLQSDTSLRNQTDNQENSRQQSQTNIRLSSTVTQSSEEIQISHPYADNPLLAPCECAGSMAFVHYMCIEQWRCRSNHPAAKNGLNCETCKSPYTLPPPPSRPEIVREEDDWMEAMPPHVLAALRRPHFWWQVGATIVRRRWLRPVAPIIVSPVVALYCRARRTLKKRGVSRRRWACSLCGRRARWKCVRCLRSYYCSRHCQNVSWHIVHKHVCYKPVRFWWSVLVYGLAVVWFIPGVLQYPMIYDLGVTLLWLSFLVMGVLGGGFATMMKRGLGVDIRGRILEFLVVTTTLMLAGISWGLAWQFFGHKNHCWGVVNIVKSFPSRVVNTSSANDSDDHRQFFSLISILWKNEAKPVETLSLPLSLVRSILLIPTKMAIDVFDGCLLQAGPWVSQAICSNDNTRSTCLEMTHIVDPDFMFPDHEGEACASDMRIVIYVYILSSLALIVGSLWKRRGRHAAAAVARIARVRQQRPHND